MELRKLLRNCPEISPSVPESDRKIGWFYLYPPGHLPPLPRGGPLLNSCWLSKEAGNAWGVEVLTDGNTREGKVRFATYRVTRGRGPEGQNPNDATVTAAVGACVHCRQAIPGMR